MPSMKKQVNLVLTAMMRTIQPKKQFYNLGLRAHKEQDSRKVLCEYVNSKLNIPVSETDSDTDHQTPTRKSARQSETGRCNHSNILIAHLHDWNLRDTIIRERRCLKNSGITIIKDLTNLNAEVLNRLRNNTDVHVCWSWNAVIKNSLNEKFCVNIYKSPHYLVKCRPLSSDGSPKCIPSKTCWQ